MIHLEFLDEGHELCVEKKKKYPYAIFSAKVQF